MTEFRKMTPYDLGESGKEEAVKYLILYLSKGTPNEKRLAASAINKLSDKYKDACKQAVPFLVENLSASHPQVRQYTLKALAKFNLKEPQYRVIKDIALRDEAEYNRRAAKEVLNNKVNQLDDEIDYKEEVVLDRASEIYSFKDTHEVRNFSKKEREFIALLNKECKIMLTKKQEAAVLHKDGPALVLAVPGAGKTTVLLARTANLIINHGINPANILSITFSKASAIDMRTRYNSIFSSIASIGANFSTIHSFAYELIRKYSVLKKINYTVIEDGNNGVSKREILKRCYLKHNGENVDEDILEEIINSIGFVKNMILREEELSQYSQEVEINNFVDIYKEYEEIKKENNYIDYDDMLTLCYEILQEDKDTLLRYRNLYKYIQIDEGQDTSKIQHKLLQLIAYPENNLFIVADDDQSIYSFRGAYPRFLMDFEKQYPETMKFYIEENFRCTKEIAEVANKFIKTNRVRFNKELFTNNEKGEPVTLVKLKSEKEQFDYLASEFCNISIEGNSAILYRNNLSAILMADELSRRGISFFLRDYNKFFFKHVVTEDVKAFINLILDNSSLENLSRIYYRINSFISRDTIQCIKESALPGETIFSEAAEAKLSRLNETQRKNYTRLKMLVLELKKASPKAVITKMENELGYNRFIKDNAKALGYSYESLRIVLTNLKALAANCSTMIEFLKRIDELSEIMEQAKQKKQSAALTLSTIHSSKGLEFSKVCIIDLIDNIIPTRGSIEKLELGKPDQLEEERRLMYVAMTRAKKNLTLILLKQKNEEAVIPSRFIDELLEI
jgi:DNA helicase II / ATP-dependent DNA helicase PcrA